MKFFCDTRFFIDDQGYAEKIRVGRVQIERDVGRLKPRTEFVAPVAEGTAYGFLPLGTNGPQLSTGYPAAHGSSMISSMSSAVVSRQTTEICGNHRQ